MELLFLFATAHDAPPLPMLRTRTLVQRRGPLAFCALNWLLQEGSCGFDNDGRRIYRVFCCFVKLIRCYEGTKVFLHVKTPQRGCPIWCRD